MLFTSLLAFSIIAFTAAAPAAIDYSGVDWKTVDYSGVDFSTIDYSNIDWSTVDYSGVNFKTINYGAAPTTTLATESKSASSVASATATATGTPTGPYGLVTIRSGSDLQYSPVYFNETLRVGGKAPQSYTPPNVNVPTTTQLAVLVGQSQMSLAVVVPGGQQNYVNTDGTIGATIPHSGAIPEGATTQGFSITPGSSSSSLSTLKFNDKRQFLACPLAGATGTYEVVVSEKTTRTDCTGVDISGTLDADYPGAWEWI